MTVWRPEFNILAQPPLRRDAPQRVAITKWVFIRDDPRKDARSFRTGRNGVIPHTARPRCPTAGRGYLRGMARYHHPKRWRAKPAPDPALVNGLVHDRCPPAAAALLVQRGITTHEAARALFRPDLDALHNPFLMADMDRAVERLEQALGDNERIMVYGDYDVDGTTAVALVYAFLSRYSSRVSFYIPDRYSEGYGISFKGIDHAQAEGVTLIVALDCGIKALDKVAYARERGIDFIICDHHRPGDTLPEAVAVLDPKRADCPYPFKELSGCGIGFKLVQALARRNDIPFSELMPLLD